MEKIPVKIHGTSVNVIKLLAHASPLRAKVLVYSSYAHKI